MVWASLSMATLRYCGDNTTQEVHVLQRVVVRTSYVYSVCVLCPFSIPLLLSILFKVILCAICRYICLSLSCSRGGATRVFVSVYVPKCVCRLPATCHIGYDFRVLLGYTFAVTVCAVAVLL